MEVDAGGGGGYYGGGGSTGPGAAGGGSGLINGPGMQYPNPFALWAGGSGRSASPYATSFYEYPLLGQASKSKPTIWFWWFRTISVIEVIIEIMGM